MSPVLPFSVRRAARTLVCAPLALGLTLASLTACSVQVGGDDTLSAAELVDQLDPQLQELKGEGAEVENLSCDGELEADVDDEQRCHFTDINEDRYGLTVTVTDVTGKDVSFDLAIDSGRTVEIEELEPSLVTELATLSGGIPPDDVMCPEALPGKVGASLTCILTAGSDRLETVVTVTAADGPDVKFDAQVAEEVLP